jgi:ABC-type sugar transport system ATPase subunit
LTIQSVITRCAADGVIARTTQNTVISLTATSKVRTGPPIDDIIAIAAQDRVIAFTAAHKVTTAPATQFVIAATADQGVLALAAEHAVVTGVATYEVATVATTYFIVARSAVYCIPAIAARYGVITDILAITPYLDRRPRALSGGQRQRVAMGRAMVKHSNAFLFDEPLSNLDAQLRVQMRKEIRALQQRIGVTSIYVTHDQVEAMTMGDRIVVMKDGRIEQVGSPSELYTAPRTRFVAGFIGSPQMSFVTAQADGHQMTLSDGTVLTSATAAKGAVTLGIRPEHFLDPTSEANRLTLEVTNQQVVGTSTSYFANLGDGEIEVIRQGSDTERPATLALGIRPEHIMVFDKDDQRIAA